MIAPRRAILAVGGGSSIDAAKVIAAMVTSRKAPEKLLGFFRLSKPMLPLFVVPTTAGTGSEVTVAAVLTDPVRHEKAARELGFEARPADDALGRAVAWFRESGYA